MINKIKGRLSFLHESSGMTLVNVLVSFVVLLMMLVMFSRVVILSQNFLVKADDLREETRILEQDYYLNGIAPETVCEDTPFRLTDGTTSFTMPSSVYSYANGGAALYSFGEHELVSAGGGDGA